MGGRGAAACRCAQRMYHSYHSYRSNHSSQDPSSQQSLRRCDDCPATLLTGQSSDVAAGQDCVHRRDDGAVVQRSAYTCWCLLQDWQENHRRTTAHCFPSVRHPKKQRLHAATHNGSPCNAGVGTICNIHHVLAAAGCLQLLGAGCPNLRVFHFQSPAVVSAVDAGFSKRSRAIKISGRKSFFRV